MSNDWDHYSFMGATAAAVMAGTTPAGVTKTLWLLVDGHQSSLRRVLGVAKMLKEPHTILVDVGVTSKKNPNNHLGK